MNLTAAAMALFLVATVHAAEDSRRFEGLVRYEVYVNSRIIFTVHERFSVLMDETRWKIITELDSTLPPSRGAPEFPLFQEVGTDGSDIFYLKKTVRGTNEVIQGKVEPGSVPPHVASPSVSFLWLAYGAPHWLATNSTSVMKPLWGVNEENESRQDKCDVPVRYRVSDGNKSFLSELLFLSDGRRNDCAPRSPKNTLPEPWSSGFTQAVYRVIQFAPGGSYPSEFQFEIFSPETNPKLVTRLVLRCRIHASVTNATRVAKDWDSLPELPGRQIVVTDYRHTATVTNYDVVPYAITNAWLARAEPKLSKLVGFYEKLPPAMEEPEIPVNTRERPKTRVSKIAQTIGLAFIVTGFAGAVALLIQLKRRRN